MKKCKDCKACTKGFFQMFPNNYVCIGTKEPFVVYDIEEYCCLKSNDNDFITAKEARLKTEENIKNYAEKEWSEIKEKINQAIKDRDFYVYYSGSMQESTIQKLLKFEYKIDHVGSNTGNYHKISW